MDLDRIDPVAIVTGATSSLGAAIAHDVAKRAEGGLILVDHDAAALDRLADQLGERGKAPERVSMLAFDVADPDWWARAGQFIKDQYGRLDWAVISAAAAPTDEGAATDLVDWRRVMSANLEGAIHAMRTIMPLMKLNTQGGAIVVTAPASSIKPDPGAKAGLLQLIRAASKEGAPDTIRINAVATNGADASNWAAMPWLRDLVSETGNERAALERIAQAPLPLARHAGAYELSRLIVMLLSDQTAASGVTLVAEGGYTI